MLSLLCLVFDAGCTSPTIEEKPFNKLPRISEFANSKAANRCIIFEIANGHQARICVIGNLAEGQQIKELLPFLNDKTSHPDASVMHERIPKELLVKAELTDLFEESDRYWLTDTKSSRDEKLIAVRVAVSEKTNHFYFEYGWSL